MVLYDSLSVFCSGGIDIGKEINNGLDPSTCPDQDGVNEISHGMAVEASEDRPLDKKAKRAIQYFAVLGVVFFVFYLKPSLINSDGFMVICVMLTILPIIMFPAKGNDDSKESSPGRMRKGKNYILKFAVYSVGLYLSWQGIYALMVRIESLSAKILLLILVVVGGLAFNLKVFRDRDRKTEPSEGARQQTLRSEINGLTINRE